jgi:hypothetical protein
MNDDIILMAREAGFAHSWSEAAGEALERFAALVAAAKQEQIARQWDALHEQYMADPLRRQMMLSYEMVAKMIRGNAK